MNVFRTKTSVKTLGEQAIERVVDALFSGSLSMAASIARGGGYKLAADLAVLYEERANAVENISFLEKRNVIVSPDELLQLADIERKIKVVEAEIKKAVNKKKIRDLEKISDHFLKMAEKAQLSAAQIELWIKVEDQLNGLQGD